MNRIATNTFIRKTHRKSMPSLAFLASCDAGPDDPAEGCG